MFVRLNPEPTKAGLNVLRKSFFELQCTDLCKNWFLDIGKLAFPLLDVLVGGLLVKLWR